MNLSCAIACLWLTSYWGLIWQHTIHPNPHGFRRYLDNWMTSWPVSAFAGAQGRALTAAVAAPLTRACKCWWRDKGTGFSAWFWRMSSSHILGEYSPCWGWPVPPPSTRQQPNTRTPAQRWWITPDPGCPLNQMSPWLCLVPKFRLSKFTVATL
jgi:hypothetical protein